ncbi:hypothetical protein C0995_009554 [Termitomyces sp. Mi166|nr:hypothetical protein C0995_009554 [Termitomyces sp. Mi166\
MDKYFKIQQAHEEVDCLNIEIQQLVTYIQNEEAYLKERGDIIAGKDSALGHQIHQQWEQLHQFNKFHMWCLHKLTALPGFTSFLILGVRVNNPWREDAMDIDGEHACGQDVKGSDDGNDSSNDEDNAQLAEKNKLIVGNSKQEARSIISMISGQPQHVWESTLPTAIDNVPDGLNTTR